MSLTTGYRILLLSGVCVTAALQGAGLGDFAGEFDTEYVRIHAVDQDKYLYADSAAGRVRHEANRDTRALDSHWYLEASGTTGEYWIRNRGSDAAMHVAGQTGEVQAGALVPGNAAYRWVFEQDGGIFRVRNGALANQYLSTETEPDDTTRYAALDMAAADQQFILTPVGRGATLPWLSYDETNYASLAAPAYIESTSYDSGVDRSLAAAEAQNNACIVLNSVGTSVAWTVRESANAAVIRYSLADGDSGTLTFSLAPAGGGPATSVSVPVSSAQAWTYFDSSGNEYATPAGGRLPARRFGEARVLLDAPAAAGDTLTLSRGAGDVAARIDVVELETATEFVPANPADYYDVTDYGAAGDGLTNDYFAILNCINAAVAAGRKVYIPAGRYKLLTRLDLPAGAHLQGAGIWHTELFFSSTSAGDGNGGVRALGSNRTIRDLYISAPTTSRSGGFKGIQGHWGTGSLIENIWVENTVVGIWMADFDAPYQVTDGLIVRGCRFRNTFADGINMSSGTINTVVENCHFRGTGDDALASWAAGYQNNVGPTTNQKFRYNTIECGYRAGGIGIFGGGAHKIHHNVVRDQYVGAGIRLNSVFVISGGTQVGYPFTATGDPIRVHDNTLVRTGARSLFGGEIGAIDLQTEDSNVTNIDFSNITIDQSQFCGIGFIGLTPSTPNPGFHSISFTDVIMQGVPIGTRATGYALGSVDFLNVTALAPATEFSLVSAFTIAYTTAIEAWQTTHFSGASDPDAQLGADPNGNGLDNLLEFAYLTDPMAMAGLAGKLPVVDVVDSEGQQYLQLSFRRRAGEGLGDTVTGHTVDGIRYVPEMSADLSSGGWQSGPALFTEAGLPLWNGDGTETVAVRAITPLGAVPQFLRMRVEALATTLPPEPPAQQVLLVDFGNDASYRGVSVANPDVNGNYWNSVWNGAYYANMTDSSGAPTTIDLGFESATGTDFYNGPSGSVQDPAACVYNAPALGELGVNAAVYDYYVSPVFQIQGLDPARTYDLTFFGSHKYNTNNTTLYEVYSDNTYTTVVASATLTVGVNAAHNQDTVVTLSGLSPQAANILYVRVSGSGGTGLGYLNALKIEANP